MDVIVSPDDIVNVLLYVQDMRLSGSTTGMHIADRAFSLTTCTHGVWSCLLAGIARCFSSHLAAQLHYTVQADTVTIVIEEAREGATACRSLADLQQKLLGRLRPSVVHLSADHLWHVDFRWMLLRDVIAYYAQLAVGSVLRIHAHKANEDHQDVLVVADRASQTEWHWRRCRLRRYLLGDMAMSGFPDNVYAVSMDGIRKYVLSQTDVSLSWNMGTCLAVCSTVCLSLECTFGLTRPQLEALCVQYSLNVAVWLHTAYVTVARKGVAVHVLVCGSAALAADESKRFDTARTEEWAFEANPALLADTVAAIDTVEAVTFVPGLQVGADLCAGFFEKVCAPAILGVESGITLDAPAATIMMELTHVSTVDVTAAVAAASCSSHRRGRRVC